MSMQVRSATIAAVLALVLGVPASAPAQESRSIAERYPGALAQVKRLSGESVVPVFDGWERNSDGSFNMVFGYFNRNYEEQLDVPIGPQNNVDGMDHGQPTHFYPRRNKFVFRVRVAKDFGKTERVVWTLTSHGRTEKANAWLIPEMEINDAVISQNMSGGIPDPDNQRPSIAGLPATRVITIGESLSLAAKVTDDALPKPPRTLSSVATGGRLELPMNRGLRVRWMYYRGPGKVTFEPDRAEPVYGQPVSLTTSVSFSQPGAYVLRLIAGDGSLESVHDVAVDVKPAATASSR